jgi:hypothetical protein
MTAEEETDAKIQALWNWADKLGGASASGFRRSHS